MTHRECIRTLCSTADRLDDARALATDGTVTLRLPADRALQLSSAAKHAAEQLALLPEVEEEDEREAPLSLLAAVAVPWTGPRRSAR